MTDRRQTDGFAMPLAKRNVWLKTNDPKSGIRNDLGLSYKCYGLGVKRSKVNVTGSQSAKKRIKCDRVAGMSLHLYRVHIVQFLLISTNIGLTLQQTYIRFTQLITIGYVQYRLNWLYLSAFDHTSSNTLLID